MFWWRVSKYDPAFRDASGRYLRDEWIGPAQIGEEFPDGVLTREEYLRVESLLTAAVLLLWRACGEPPLQIRALEGPGMFGLPPASDELDDVGFEGWRPANGEYVPGGLVGAMVRWCLRDLGWCQLDGDGFCVHFGYDFYLWVGTREPADAARREIAASGVFVEPSSARIREDSPRAFVVEACRIGDNLLDHEIALTGLSAEAIAHLWPEVPALVGYRHRTIDADLASRIARYAEIPFDFERFTYVLALAP